MLTPEQTRLRRQDNELRELRIENEKLKERIREIKVAFKGAVLALAERLPFSMRTQIRAMVDDIDV